MLKHRQIISKFNKKNILVIGDIMLDRHIVGSVSRISPEAPVPIVLEERSFYTPGGASNVAQNLKALGANVIQIGCVGTDPEGVLLKQNLKNQGIDTQGVFTVKGIPTITKTRVIAQHQQVVRIDREKKGVKWDKALIGKIFRCVQNNIDDCDALIISDYGKGLITPEVLSFVRDLALARKKIITVDPKVEHFGYYRHVTAITPNKKEAENAIRNIKIREASGHQLEIDNDQLETDAQIDHAGEQLVKYLNLESLLLTLGEHGMRLFEKGKQPVRIKTEAKEVYDVTGAGDAVISAFTLSLTAGATKREAAEISNIAAGIVVGKMGAVAVTKEELMEAMK